MPMLAGVMGAAIRGSSRPSWVLPGATTQLDLADRRAWLNGAAYYDEASIKALFSTFSTPAHFATDTDGVLRSVAANSLDSFTVPSGKCEGQLLEEARTPVAVYSRTLDPLAWTLTNMTRSSAVGADGQPGAATQLTATGANATAIAPAATLASAARRFAPYIRRISGTGNIDVTFDNGSTWTTLSAPTGVYTRIGAGATVANPQIGIRIATSGDEILVDFANGETGSSDTSPIATAGSLIIRAASNIYRDTGSELVVPGVLFADITDNGSMTNFGVSISAAADANTRVNLRQALSTRVDVIYFTSGVSQGVITRTISGSLSAKMAARYETNNCLLVANGVASGVLSPAAVGGYTRLNLKYPSSGGATGSAYYKTVALFPGLSESQMQALTS